MVERLLAKEKVAGSIPVSRFYFAQKVVRYLVYRKMYIVQRATFLCKERCGAPLESMQSKGSGLPRLKSGSVGSAEKRSTGPFFVSASPRLVSLFCPKVVRYLVYRKMYIVQRAKC